MANRVITLVLDTATNNYMLNSSSVTNAVGSFADAGGGNTTVTLSAKPVGLDDFQYDYVELSITGSGQAAYNGTWEVIDINWTNKQFIIPVTYIDDPATSGDMVFDFSSYDSSLITHIRAGIGTCIPADDKDNPFQKRVASLHGITLQFDDS